MPRKLRDVGKYFNPCALTSDSSPSCWNVHITGANVSSCRLFEMQSEYHQINSVWKIFSGFLLVICLVCLLDACVGDEGGGPTSSTNGDPIPNTVSGTVMFNGAPTAGATRNRVHHDYQFYVRRHYCRCEWQLHLYGVPTGGDATPNLQFMACTIFPGQALVIR